MSRTERAARLVEGSGLGALLRRHPLWRGVLVLTYHRIVEDERQLLARALWSATPGGFREQIRFIAEHCEPIAVDALEDRVHARRPSVLITFDDGYRDNVEIALPILREHGVPAVFFVTTGFLDGTATAWWDEIAWIVAHATNNDWSGSASAGAPSSVIDPAQALIRRYQRLRASEQEPLLEWLAEATGSGRRPRDDGHRDWMSWDDARRLTDAGMTVGAHTVTHPVLASLSREAQRNEIVGSLARIEQELGHRPEVFSYPIGTRHSVDDRARAEAAASGTRLAFSNRGGMARPGAWDPFDVPRSNVRDTTTRPEFRAMSAVPRLLARW
jgi:peptidoglycan/xylan/chitin deacetylase (PgdA/CDA1 family)